METGKATGSEFVAELDKDVSLHVECRVDPARQQEELEDLLSSMAEADDGASGPAAAGAAATTIAPPRHPTDLPRASESSPDRQAHRFFLKAVRAVRTGEMKEAVRLQNLAFQQCLSVENASLAVEMELLLATYAVQAAGGENAPLRAALSIFQRASERAYKAGLIVAGAKIDIILAPMANLVGQYELAGQALRRAADRSRTEAPALSIEALRLAAEFMLENANQAKTAELLREALALAIGLPPAEAKDTAASKCAKTLAALLRDQKQDPEAAEMDLLAARLTTG